MVRERYVKSTYNYYNVILHLHLCVSTCSIISLIFVFFSSRQRHLVINRRSYSAVVTITLVSTGENASVFVLTTGSALSASANTVTMETYVKHSSLPPAKSTGLFPSL